MKEKIIEYIKQLEKRYVYYENRAFELLSIDNCMYDYYKGKADSIRATINDLNDILADRTYEERLDKILEKERIKWKDNGGNFSAMLKKNQLYKSKIAYYAVPWLVTYLYRSMKKGNKKDIDDILKTLVEIHNITLDDKGNLCFIKDNKSEVK